MSLLDVAPIIEQMLLISENVSDLNFSCGQKPQVEINGVLYPASPLGLGQAVGISDRDDRDVAHPRQSGRRRTARQVPNGRPELRTAGQMPFSRQYFSAAKFVLDRNACHSARDTDVSNRCGCRRSLLK